MFEIIKIKDNISVPQQFLNLNKEERVLNTLQDFYEDKIMPDIGVVISIIKVNSIEGGYINIDDPKIHYTTSFDALIFIPKLHQIIEGYVVDIVDFGVFIRFGPIDALCHISQVVDGYINIDKKAKIISIKNTKKRLKIGDLVRCRIIGVSLNKKEINKIIVTMRQKGLGCIEWIESDKKEKAKGKK
ncbi:MAG: DNA-directed RNA polymerase [Candidatus Aenigmarchaeota archaeon ex4484_52]|nr:MAG: DNA-directed RNA polymerase [Candidatus Aenigmarchaeota archaeon ex4484_52]